METPIDLPSFAVIDEWEETINDITLVYRIKTTSGGGGKPIWYSAACWQRGVPSPSVSGKFDERPDRRQVEARFRNSAAEIVKRAAELKKQNRALIYNQPLFLQETTDESDGDPLVKTIEKITAVRAKCNGC